MVDLLLIKLLVLLLFILSTVNEVLPVTDPVWWNEDEEDGDEVTVGLIILLLLFIKLLLQLDVETTTLDSVGLFVVVIELHKLFVLFVKDDEDELLRCTQEDSNLWFIEPLFTFKLVQSSSSLFVELFILDGLLFEYLDSVKLFNWDVLFDRPPLYWRNEWLLLRRIKNMKD